VTLDPPSALAPRVLNALKADPRTVDLRALAPHFYNLGARILELFEEEEMIDVLSDVRVTLSDSDASTLLTAKQTFRARAAVIADQAHNPRGALGEGVEFMRGLDENERQCKAETCCHVLEHDSMLTSIVFRASHDSAKAVRVWMTDLKKK
jgi:GINS complex subunit 3